MADSKHATPLGEIADDFDQIVEDDREWLVGNLTAWAHGDPNDPGWLRMLRHGVAGYAYVDFHIATGVASGFADALRFGDGFAKGYQNGDYWGYVEDVMRGLTLLGPVAHGARLAKVGFGRAVGPGLARFIKQVPGSLNCTWITSVKALRMTGVKPFARLSDLVRKAAIPGIASAKQTGPGYLEPLMNGLRRLGARPKELSFHTVEELLNFSRTNSRGVVAFGVTYPSGGHALLMQGGKIYDPFGAVYKSVAAFENAYPGATLVRNLWSPGMGSQYFIPQAAVTMSRLSQQLGQLGTFTALLHSLSLEMNELELGVRFDAGPARPAARQQPARPQAQRRLTVELKAHEQLVFDALPFGQLMGDAELMRSTGLSAYELSMALRGLSGHNLIVREVGPTTDVSFGWVRVF